MTQRLQDKLGCEFSSKIQILPLTHAFAASPPSHLLSDVPILLSHGGTTGCKWPKSPRVGGLSVTCRVTQQPTDAIVEEQRQQEGSLSTGKQDDVLILWFQWYVAGQVSIVILPKQAGQNGPKQVGQKGNCCFLGRPGQGWSGKGRAAGCDGPSVRASALSGSLLPTEDAPLWELSDTRLRSSLLPPPPPQIPLPQVPGPLAVMRKGKSQQGPNPPLWAALHVG